MSKDVKAKAGSTSAKNEAVIGASARALSKAVSEIKKVGEGIEEAAKLAESITEEISVKNAELANLTTQFEESKRKGEADLAVSLLENKKGVVSNILAETGQIAVDEAEYNSTKADIAKLKTDFAAEVAKETAIIRNQEISKYNNQIALNTAQASATNAEQAANLKAANAQVEFFKSQNAELIKQLDAERAARVSEAQARGNAVVNVTNTK